MALLLAVRGYVKHTGTWAVATLREPGAWRAWLMIGIMLTGMAVAIAAHDLLVSAGAAIVIVATCALLGPSWDRSWVHNLERQP